MRLRVIVCQQNPDSIDIESHEITNRLFRLFQLFVLEAVFLDIHCNF